MGSGNVVKAFAGLRDDPFFFDLIFGFRLLGIRPGGPLTAPAGHRFLRGDQLQHPRARAPGVVVAGPSRRRAANLGHDRAAENDGAIGLSVYLADTQSGPYVQIDRMAIPVENTVLMPTRLKDAFNRSVPAQDHLFREEAILHLVAINNDRDVLADARRRGALSGRADARRLPGLPPVS